MNNTIHEMYFGGRKFPVDTSFYTFIYPRNRNAIISSIIKF